MNICFLTTTFPRFKGDMYQNFVLNLAKGLQEKGNQIKVVCAGDKDTPAKHYINNIEIYRFFYMLPKRLQKLTYQGGMADIIKDYFLVRFQIIPFLINFFLRAYKVIKKSDIISAQLIPSAFISILINKIYKLKKINTIPIVLYIRGADIRYSFDNILLKSLTKFVLKNVDLIISMGPNLTDMIKKHGNYKVHEMHNPFDINVVKKKYNTNKIKNEFNINKKDIIITTNGRLANFRDPLLLIKSMNIVLKKIKKIKFFIIGEGYLKNECIKLINKYSLQNKIFLTGRRDDVFNFNIISDIFISMGRIENIWSNSLIEAFAFQIPAIAFDVGYTSKILKHNKHLFLVPHNKPLELSNAIIKLIKDKSLRKKLCKNGYHYIKNNNFLKEDVLKYTINLYQSVINKNIKRI